MYFLTQSRLCTYEIKKPGDHDFDNFGQKITKKPLLLFYLVEVKTPRVLRRTELKRAQVYDGLVSDIRL